MTMAVKICKMYKKAEMLQPRSLMSTYIELVSLQRNQQQILHSAEGHMKKKIEPKGKKPTKKPTEMDNGLIEIIMVIGGVYNLHSSKCLKGGAWKICCTVLAI